ncbi:50S ribosomal protein L11 methyltransferase [Nonlabens xiamenensis]|uniref:50S ribosomal protein L11 methyltransferase n=1 Tax=Nonlabens xiamenensis TaxID=2341043 RepID=UPI000F60FD53|nr:50S ribosomal protein L11 methyltransferase [Nonlabens xiamenensis]
MQTHSTDLKYVEYTFELTPKDPWNDVLMAQLGEVGFESFMETDQGCKAYILQSKDHKNLLDQVELMHNGWCDVAFAKADVPATNWNAEWEKNFDPITVDDRCQVRAPFHQAKEVEYDIVIEPKMSFGTGHHQTTHMMIQHLLKEDLSGLEVLDMGSGTGVLAILARMRGATRVDAIDIDTWCYENALENVERNKVDQIEVILGGAEQLEGRSYDMIIANINRNILLQDIPTYANSLKSGGLILFSGFYTEDLQQIMDCCRAHGMEYVMHLTKDNWVAPKAMKG